MQVPKNLTENVKASLQNPPLIMCLSVVKHSQVQSSVYIKLKRIVKLPNSSKREDNPAVGNNHKPEKKKIKNAIKV